MAPPQTREYGRNARSARQPAQKAAFLDCLRAVKQLD
jgi:hypothetical protein